MSKTITDPILKDLLLAHVSNRVDQLNRELCINEIPGGREIKDLQRYDQPNEGKVLYYFEIWFTKGRNSNGVRTGQRELKDYYVFRISSNGRIHG